MTEILSLVHPAPVTHVPRGARKERVEFARMTTPVTPHRADPGDVVLAAGGEGIEPIYECDGTYWQRPRGRWKDAPQAPGLAPVLEGRITHASLFSNTYEWLVARTPLCGWHEDAARVGGELNIANTRSMVDDGRAWAQAAASRFVSEEILLAGDDLYVRFHGPMATSSYSAGYESRREGLPDRAVHTRGWLATAYGEFCVRDDTLDVDTLLGGGLARHWHRPSSRQAEAYSGLDPSRFGDGDVMMMLNQIPLRLCTQVASLQRRDLGDLEEVDRAMLALRPWRGRCHIGGIGRDDAPEVIRAALACTDALRSAPEADYLNHALGMAAYLREVAMPRLEPSTPALTDDDEEALRGIAP